MKMSFFTMYTWRKTKGVGVSKGKNLVLWKGILKYYKQATVNSKKNN